MDLDALRVFVKVAELGSFTRASEHLGLSKARASIRIQELEASLGSRLLHRSTRTVRLTTDGEQFLARARRLVADADELAAMFSTPSNLRGRVRLDCRSASRATSSSRACRSFSRIIHNSRCW